MADMKSWDCIKELNDKGSKLEMVSIHPAAIIGPTLTKDTNFTSMSFLEHLALGKYPMLPKVSFGLSDVRDCAEMHVNALSAPSGHRYILCEDTYYVHEVAQWIKEDFGDKGFDPKIRIMPYSLAWALQIFNTQLGTNIGMWDKKVKFDTSLAKKHLGYEPTPSRESLRDMIESAIEQGYIKPK